MDKKQFKELEKLLEKCFNREDKPFKWEHANALVKKTHEHNITEYIWTFPDVRKNLTTNPIIAWKFCCLMHKILHEGHSHAIKYSIIYKEKFQHCIKYWSGQNDPLAKCIVCYCKVLLRKLLFHLTHGAYDGNLQFNDEIRGDINICYELCLDLFDYLEDLLNLQRVIFTNMEEYQISVTSKKGMCRLSGLATSLKECNLLYIHLVDILRLLFSQLSPDNISGLSERFNVIFIELKFFFEHVRSQSLQLDHDLLIPYLPTVMPNLLTSIDENLPEPSAPSLYELE
ncbi:huntington interacting protein related 1-like [Cochliomyia hominivorax]